MFIRQLLSVASLTVALVGGVVIDCTSPAVEILNGDPTGVCAVVAPLGADGGLWVGTGLGVFAIIALILIWVPAAGGRRWRNVEPVASLQDNLSRLVEIESDSPAPRPRADVLHVVRLTRKVEALEVALADDVIATREVTVEWMRLLREANDLHNRHQLPTEDFKRINTRLLHLFSPPTEETEELRGTAASQQ